MKYIVALLFLSVVFLGYTSWKQHNLIQFVAEGTAMALNASADLVIKNAEQDALIKQIMGVDFENREQLLFRAFDAPKIEY